MKWTNDYEKASKFLREYNGHFNKVVVYTSIESWAAGTPDGEYKKIKDIPKEYLKSKVIDWDIDVDNNLHVEIKEGI